MKTEINAQGRPKTKTFLNILGSYSVILPTGSSNLTVFLKTYFALIN
jgi:hypothetical protein